MFDVLLISLAVFAAMELRWFWACCNCFGGGGGPFDDCTACDGSGPPSVLTVTMAGDHQGYDINPGCCKWTHTFDLDVQSGPTCQWDLGAQEIVCDRVNDATLDVGTIIECYDNQAAYNAQGYCAQTFASFPVWVAVILTDDDDCQGGSPGTMTQYWYRLDGPVGSYTYIADNDQGGCFTAFTIGTLDVSK